MRTNGASGIQQAAVQRAGILAELPALLSEAGVPPALAFAGSGISAATLSPETRLPFHAATSVLQRAAELTACPHIGLLLGQRFDLAHHGIMGQLMRSSPTLGQALRAFTQWQPGYSSGAIVYLQPLGDDFAFGYGAAGGGTRELYDVVSVLGMRMLKQLTDGAVQPEEFHLSFRPPEDKASYARHLGAPVRFNQQRVCLVLPARHLAAPLPGADAEGHRQAMSAIKSAVERARPGVTQRTCHALRRVLQEGPPSMETVARELAMHPRTLRRRLAGEQASFESLCDAVRFEMAREFLDLTDLPVSDIGAALAYASPGNFSDAFHRWSGVSPRAWRLRTRPAGPLGASP